MAQITIGRNDLKVPYNKSMQPTAERRRLLVLGPAAADLNSYTDLVLVKE